jgi:CrcB protein
VSTPYLWVALGGAIGACARYATNVAALKVLPATFPWGTFIVNALGCFLFGILAGLAISRGLFGPASRAFLLVGVLGGFTTFSSFAFESVELVRTGQAAAAVANTAGQVLAGVFAVWFGLLLTR